MMIKQLKIEDYKQVIQDAITNKEECLLYAILPSNIIYKGKGEIDEQYAIANGFDIYNSVDFGCGIVGFEGDIVLVIIKQDGWILGEQVINRLAEFLYKEGLNVTVDNNDILIDGVYKVASYSSTKIGDNVIYTGIQVTFNANADIIRHICKKDSVKVPRGLGYYGLNNQSILDVLFTIIGGIYA